MFRIFPALFVALLLSLSLLGTSCGSHDAREINEKYREIIEQRNAIYTLKSGDQVTVQLYDVEGGLSAQTGLILPDGRTDLFFLPNHLAATKSVDEFEEELKQGIRGEITDPEISVQVVPSAEVVYMVGQWSRPGPVPLQPKMTLREAIAFAGGDNILGRPWNVVLRRPYSQPTKPEIFYLNIWEDEEEVVLLPGDIIENDRNLAAMVVAVLREYIFGVIPSQVYGGAIAGGL